MSIVDATNSRAISGTPRMNSMNSTHRMRTAGRSDVRPSARAMPIGSENEIPVTPMMRVSMKPPNWSVSTGFRPNPPTSSQPTRNGNAATYQNQCLRPGSLS